MRLSIFIICLSLLPSNTLAQVPGTDKTSQTDTQSFDCPAFVPQTPSSDRIGDARKCYQKGLELSERGQLVEAAAIFRQALQFNPEYAEAYAALGRTYFKLREWHKAVENLNRAASLNRKQREANESPLKTAPPAETQPLPKPSRVAAPSLTHKVNPPPASFTQNTAAIIEVNKALALIPAPPAETPAPSKAPEQEEIKTVAEPTPPANMKENPGPTVSTIPPTEELPLTKIYRVGPNDVLDIRLNDPGQQSTLYTVTAAGLLEHPLLNEPISVAGLTVEEIGTRLDEDLRKRAIIENPKAVVGVRDYASHAVLVSGLVKNAGTKFLRREAIPLYVVVADAQPLPEAAKVSVVRNESNQIFEIDLDQAADMNFLVRSGDVITLSPNTTQFIYIGGEVKVPGEKTFRRGLTLMQAILSAGGVGPKAKIAEIARDDGKGFLVPTRFKLKEIVSGTEMDPVLKPGDRISILR